MDSVCVPSYATLPRNRHTTRNPRSQSLVPNSPQHKSLRRVVAAHSSAMPPPKTRFTDGAKTPTSNSSGSGGEGSRSNGSHNSRDLSHPGSPSTLSRRGLKMSGSTEQIKSARPLVDTDEFHPVCISTIPRKHVNTYRISKEEQIAKRKERERRKHEYYSNTPSNKINITEKDLEVYVKFYEKRLTRIMQNMDLNIALEKRKKVKMESKLKYLLADHDTLRLQLSNIRKDLKTCQSRTETVV